MNEALCSIVTGENEWCFDSEGRSIKFNKDGTGELWCRRNLNCWIAAVLEWKSIKPLDRVEPPGQIVEITSTTQNKTPHLLGQLNLEITLTKRLPQRAEASVFKASTVVNEHCLTDDAFRPKSYTIRIEKGNFREPCLIGPTDSSSYRSRFALRLVFDKSPYPEKPEWKYPDRGPDGGLFWDHKEFVGRSSPELEEQGRAMNDDSPVGWTSCAVS